MGKSGERDPAAPRAHAGSESAVVRAAPAHGPDEHDRRLRCLSENVPTVMLYQLAAEPDGRRRFTYVSATVETMHGLSPERVLQDASLIYGQIHAEDRGRVRDAEERSLRDGTPLEIELRSTSERGLRWLLLRATPRQLPGDAPGWDGVELDITASKLHEAERARLEESLRHAQRLESVGRLAGGVAHDFNNMLTAIMGNVAMARSELPDDDPVCEMLDEATSAACAAESLTRQLLAFSRKQLLEPRVLDLNELTERTSKLLARVLGEDLQLRTSLAPGLGSIRADPGQLEQLVVNLAVNARDAMPGGGLLRFTTFDVRLEPARAEPLQLSPGAYVVLSVRDEGASMSPGTKSRPLEPFFTAKGVPNGSEPGLATVYGAVKQCGGKLEVVSGPGAGSEYRLYFPRAEPAESARPTALSPLYRGSERVLVVEDEPLVRSLARTVLERQGYAVVTCASGNEALAALANSADRPIDLLLTDLVMPGMGGRELAERVRELRPQVRVLFTSGYSEDSVLLQSITLPRAQFLGKPYSVQELSRRVRELLDAVP